MGPGGTKTIPQHYMKERSMFSVAMMAKRTTMSSKCLTLTLTFGPHLKLMTTSPTEGMATLLLLSMKRFILLAAGLALGHLLLMTSMNLTSNSKSGANFHLLENHLDLETCTLLMQLVVKFLFLEEVMGRTI